MPPGVGLCDVDLCGPSAALAMGVGEEKVVASEFGWTPVVSRLGAGDDHPWGGVKVMSMAFLLGTGDQAVVWRGPKKTSLIRKFLKDTFWGKLESLVFDTPPGTSDEHLTVVQTLVKAAVPKGAVIVTTPQKSALETVKREIHFCRKFNVPILGVVENMAGFVCPCCDDVTPIFAPITSPDSDLTGGALLAQQFDVPFLGSLPLDPTLGAAAEAGTHPLISDPDSPLSVSLRAIIDNLCAQLSP